MSDRGDARIVCEGCGKSYRWKPRLAGRRVRCGCGHVMRVPDRPPDIQKEDSTDAWALADTAPPPGGAARVTRCFSCGAALGEGAVICVECGANLKTGRKHRSLVEDAPEEDDGDGDEPVRPSSVRYAAAWITARFPGLFRPFVLIGAILMGTIGLGILGLGIVFAFGLGVILSGMAIISVGSLAWAQAIAFILDGEFSLLPDALTEFDQTQWYLWFIGLVAPGITLMVLVRYSNLL